MRVTETAAPADHVAFHRLLREAPRFRWWRPLALIALTAIYALSLSALVQTLLTPLLAVTGSGTPAAVAARLAGPDTQDPVAILVTLASLASWLLAVPAAMWSVGISPIGRVASVALRPRWGLLLRCLVPAVVVLAVIEAVSLGLSFWGAPGAALGRPAGFDAGLALWSVLIVVLLVPLQAAGEEVVFRGVLLQSFGAWIKNPIIPIVVPTLIFASLHVYDVWGLAQVAVLGVLSGWLAWRTGGLEAAISLHIVNNLAVYLLLASGITGATAQAAGAAGPLSLFITTVGLLGYAWAAVTIFDRGSWARWSSARGTSSPERTPSR